MTSYCDVPGITRPLHATGPPAAGRQNQCSPAQKFVSVSVQLNTDPFRTGKNLRELKID